MVRGAALSVPIIISSTPPPLTDLHPFPLPYPRLLLQLGHHDDIGRVLFPDRPPEVTKGLGEGALGGDVGVLTAVAIDIVGVDVITAWDTCLVRRDWKWFFDFIFHMNMILIRIRN